MPFGRGPSGLDPWGCDAGQDPEDFMDKKLHRIEHDADPGRCQSGGKHGQCPYLSMAACVERHLLEVANPTDYINSHTCARHGGEKKATTVRKERTHDYRLSIWQERMDEFAESEQAKSLRGEIGVTRLMIEQILNQCEDTQQLLMWSARIQQLVSSCEKLVRTAERLEKGAGSMMDRTAGLAFASEVIESISCEIEDPDVVDRISGRIIDALGKQNG